MSYPDTIILKHNLTVFSISMLFFYDKFCKSLFFFVMHLFAHFIQPHKNNPIPEPLQCGIRAIASCPKMENSPAAESSNGTSRMIPSTYVELTTDDDKKFMNLLLEKLEEDDDVLSVFHNWENQDE